MYSWRRPCLLVLLSLCPSLLFSLERRVITLELYLSQKEQSTNPTLFPEVSAGHPGPSVNAMEGGMEGQMDMLMNRVLDSEF